MIRMNGGVRIGMLLEEVSIRRILCGGFVCGGSWVVGNA